MFIDDVDLNRVLEIGRVKAWYTLMSHVLSSRKLRWEWYV